MSRRSPGTERSLLVAGVMSGTSVDGIDVALVRLDGHGAAIAWTVEGWGSSPFPAGLRDLLLSMGEAESVRMDDVARAHVRLAHAYAAAIREVAGAAIPDLVGCHGQTVRHLPEEEEFLGAPVRATLQLGSGPALAQLVGAPVVSDFRAADMALGGQGAPLVPYVDWALLRDGTEHRAALNLGGIANVTVIPAGSEPEEIVAFDTGPGNMVVDALSRAYLGTPYDRGGEAALGGSADPVLLGELLDAPYFSRRPPKSTGREAYGAAFVAAFERRADERALPPADRLATAAALTADSVTRALRDFAPSPLDRILVSGGGVHNRAVMTRIASAMPRTRIASSAEVGLDPDAKEAVAFAVLAHETFAGVPTGMPGVTGARRPAILGSVSRPA